MADITIIRNGARISLASFPKLGSGSENIAVAVSASGAYDTYTTELYYGWYQGSSMQKMLAQYQNGLYYIPSNALFNAGNVYLTLRLVSGGNKVSTNTIPITIEKSAVNNEYSILPATETWQNAVDNYINNSNSFLNKRLDNIVAQSGNDNTEIVDSRVGAYSLGTYTYNNLGGAIRGQVDRLMEDYYYLATGKNTSFVIWEQGGFSNSGELNTWSMQIRSDRFIYVGIKNSIFITTSNGLKVFLRWYEDPSFTKYISSNDDITGEIIAPSAYVRIIVTQSDMQSNITPSDGANVKIETYQRNTNSNAHVITLDNQGGDNDDSKYVNVDTLNKTITFPTNSFCDLVCGNKQFDLTGKTVTYPGFACSIYYNYINDEVMAIDNRANSLCSKEYIFLGTILGDTNIVNLNIYPYYYVNGIRTYKDDRGIHNVCRKYRVQNHKIKFSVLGDSTSSFNGVSETTNNGVTVRAPYYPSGDVTDKSQMWWSYVQKALRNNIDYDISAVSSSAFINQNDTLPSSSDTNRIKRLGDHGTPHIIFINMGINDGYFLQQGEFSGEWDINKIANEDNTVAKGIELTIRNLQATYQNSDIVLLIPKNSHIVLSDNDYTKRFNATCKLIKEIGEAYGVYKIIDLRKCGITWENYETYTIDGVHPNAKGMELIGKYVASELMK